LNVSFFPFNCKAGGFIEIEKCKTSWAPVAYTCNPSYSGGRDQEDCGSKPGWATVHEPLSQKYLTQKGLVEWLKV
jgi:hypothetical protein